MKTIAILALLALTGCAGTTTADYTPPQTTPVYK